MAKRIPHNLIVLEKWQIDFIKENFFKLTNPQIADAIGLNFTTTRKHCYRMGFKRMSLEYWDDTMIRFLRLYYKYLGDTELAEVFTKHWLKDKGWTKKHIEKKRRYLFLKRTECEKKLVHRRNVVLGRYAICVIKRWEKTGVCEIGAVRIWNICGIKTAFIKTSKGFVPRNRWLWMEKYGEIFRDEIIWALPNAPVICEIWHLEKISIKELGTRNKLSDSSIAKSLFKVKDKAEAVKLAENNPGLIELKRNILKLNRKLNESSRKN